MGIVSDAICILCIYHKTHSPRLFKQIKMSYIGNNEQFNQLRCFSIKKARICNQGLKHIE